MNIALLFPGQGAQTVGMGKDFCEAYPAADHIFERASDACGINLRKLCFEGPEDQLTRTDISQPAILTTSLAVLEVLSGIGALKGHDIVGMAGLSLGEYSAHVAAGSMDLETAVKLVRRRGELMQQCAERHPGAMAAVVGLDAEKVQAIVEEASGAGIVTVANYNAPDQQVVSGEAAAVDKAVELAESAGARVMRLKVAGAFHSPLMQEAADELMAELQTVEFRDDLLPLVSNVTAEVVSDAETIPATLSKQLTSSVRWVDGVRKLIDLGAEQFIEMAPGKVLRGLVRKIDRSVPCVSVNTVDAVDKVPEAKDTV